MYDDTDLIYNNSATRRDISFASGALFLDDWVGMLFVVHIILFPKH
jgi:hypothetical protein